MRRLIGGALLVALACGCNPPSDNPSTTSTTTMNSAPASGAPAMASSGSPEVAASGAAAMAGSGSPALAASGSPAGDAGKMVKLPDGLQYEDQAVGTGPEAKAGDTVTVNYVGTLTNGTKFDASADHGTPFSFPLGQHKVIAGWDEGVAGMKKGGKRHLVIPPSLGYGPQAMGDKIPANSTLVFDVELVSISPK